MFKVACIQICSGNDVKKNIKKIIKFINKSIDSINGILTEYCPPLEGDKTIQIGCSFINDFS